MASVIRRQRRGVYDKTPLPNGQVKHTKVDEVVTDWVIAIYEGRNDLISITKNDEETRTYKVVMESGYAIKIRKLQIGSNWGAKSLFELFAEIDSEADYRFSYLEKIWDWCRAVK